MVALAVVLLGVVGSLCIAAARSALVPAKFSFDAHLIQQLASTGGDAGVDRSYSNTAALYRVLGMQDAPGLVSVLTVVLFGLLVLIALRSSPGGGLTVPLAIFAALVLVLGSIFLGTYSKDAPVLLVSAALLLCGGNRRAEAVVIGLIVTYAMLFRTYWFLILAVYLGMRVLRLMRPSRAMWLVGPLIAIVLIGVGMVLVLHHPADYFRSSVNLARAGDADSRSMVQPFIALGEPVSGIVNVVLTFFALFAPVPLLFMGGGYYIAIFALFGLIWVAFWIAVLERVPAGPDASGRYRAIAFLLAFVCVQAFFEPDYGSALRHLSPLLPVLLFIVGGRRHLRGASCAPRLADDSFKAVSRRRVGHRNHPTEPAVAAPTSALPEGGEVAPGTREGVRVG